jgi:F-type H+-transporting ATPase subunit gamma
VASGQLRDTRRRIRSVEATKKITRAMELIATARIPKAQGRVQASKPYAEKMVEVIRNVSAAAGDVAHPLADQRSSVGAVGILCVASDRGLCGAYATTIIRAAEQQAIEHRRAGRDVVIYAVGQKAVSYFGYRGYEIATQFLDVTDTPGYGDARVITGAVVEGFVSGRVDQVDAFYTRYQSALTQVPTEYRLLPIQPPGDDGVETRTVDYSYEPSPAGILDRLLPRYVEATIFNMLLEASASEHAARRRAMKAATDNAEELIRALTIQANRQRQAEITTAITEIVGGAEALGA